jgi:hypothetical protein
MEAVMIQNLKCEKCGTLLAELHEDRIVSHDVGIRIDPKAYSEGLAWAVCTRCSHETPFDATWFKALTNT